MKDKLKSIEKMMEKELSQYAQEIDSGKQMTEKDPERIAHLSMALTFSKLLCLIESLKNDADSGEGMLGKLLGGGSSDKQTKVGGGNMFGGGGGMNPFGMAMRMIGFDRDEDHGGDGPYMRKGVPGSGRGGRSNMTYDTYDHYDNDDEDNYHYDDNPQMARRRSTRTGRFIRNNSDGYDGSNMRSNSDGGNMTYNNGGVNNSTVSTPSTTSTTTGNNNVGPVRR